MAGPVSQHPVFGRHIAAGATTRCRYAATGDHARGAAAHPAGG
jgi:hypothetical protein